MIKYLGEEFDYLGYLPEKNMVCPFCKQQAVVTIGINLYANYQIFLCYHCQRKFTSIEDALVVDIDQLCNKIQEMEAQDVTL